MSVGDVLEPPAVDVLVQHVGHQRRVVGPAGPQVDVEEAVVVDVAEVRPHRQHDPVQPDLRRDVAEARRPEIAVEAGMALRRLGRPSGSADHVVEARPRSR